MKPVRVQVTRVLHCVSNTFAVSMALRFWANHSYRTDKQTGCNTSSVLWL